MTTYIFHVAGYLERWDSIAYKYYKNTYEIQKLIDANPHIPITGIIKEGTEIKVPIDEDVKTDSKLPIWKKKNK